MTIPAGYAQISHHHTFPGVTGTADVVVGCNPTGATFAIAAAMRDAWQDNMLFAMSSDVTFVGATVRFGQDGGPDLVFDLSPNGSLATVGQRAGNSLPGNCCILVKKVTGVSGRANQGRMYLPGARETDYLANSRLDSGAQTALQALVISYQTDMEAVPAPLVVLHSPPSVATPTPLASPGLSVESLVATQRRRIR